ncbi:hypothetical protein [Epilithonimonas hispanica]|uniref:Lipoprotein n=1 Tax=Epilithonimonas hispanica TaxID=358687 RepID=A0A3D9CWN1_9FLAO|nr:hypothetical protein [Epilithonimonas hispanica]REC70144.1 hypothetical protein DRF58_10755 [Epilithonimonas hispanica]
MKNLIKYLALFITFISLTSCFDIIDKMSLKADGSGEYSIILNASKSKTRLQSISKMETINGKKVPKKSEIESKLKEASEIFKTVPGISQVKTSFDAENYIIKLSCNFKKIENINAGLEKLKAKNMIGKTIPTQLYKNNVAEKTFIRNKINSFKNDYNKLSSTDKEVFNNATYTSILQFESVIKSQTNNTYAISPNKKALKINSNILDFVLEKKQVQNTISLQ